VVPTGLVGRARTAERPARVEPAVRRGTGPRCPLWRTGGLCLPLRLARWPPGPTGARVARRQATLVCSGVQRVTGGLRAEEVTGLATSTVDVARRAMVRAVVRVSVAVMSLTMATPAVAMVETSWSAVPALVQRARMARGHHACMGSPGPQGSPRPPPTEMA